MQSPPRALQERLTLTRDALAHARARKPFGMRSYEKCARNPFGIRSYKIIGLKVPWNQHLQKMWGGLPPPCLSQSSFVVRCSLLLICGSNFFSARLCCVLPSAFTSGSGVLCCGVRSREGGTADAWNFGLCATIPRKPRQARKGATVAGVLRVPRRTRSSSHRFIRILL